MSRSIPPEIDLIAIYQQHCAELAQAHSLPAGVASCAALLDACFSPQSCQIVWSAGFNPRTLGPDADAPPNLPTEAELSWLEQGELAIRFAGERPSECFAPLRARG